MHVTKDTKIFTEALLKDKTMLIIQLIITSRYYKVSKNNLG